MFFNQQKVRDNIQLVLLAILCCFNILPSGLQSIAVISFCFISILFNYKTILIEIKNRKITVYIVTIFWLVLLYTTVFYSFETKAGLVYFKKSISIILIPFILYYCFPRLNREYIRLLLKIFIFSNVIFVVYIYYYIVQNLSITYLPNISAVTVFEQIKIMLAAPYEEVMWYGIKFGEKTPLMIHKTYLSLSLTFSVFSVFHFFITKKNRLTVNILWLLIVLLFSFTVFYFLSKVNIPLLIFGVIFLITTYFKNFKQKIIVVSVCLTLLISGVFLSLNLIENKVIQNSINSKINYIYNIIGSNNLTPKDEIDKRALINECSKTLFLERPFFGYGLGVQHVYLLDCFAQKKEFVLVEENFNTHNHYYFLLLSGGVMVLLPFLFLLWYVLMIALKNKNHLFVLFLILIIFNLSVENMLTRINGILFFSLFLPLLYRYCASNFKAQ